MKGAVPFASPAELKVTLQLPHRGAVSGWAWACLTYPYPYLYPSSTPTPTPKQVSGMGVRPILERSGLPVDTLRQVWNLSDIDRDGQLDSDEFAVAMHLTRECGGTAKVTPDPIGHGQWCPGSRRPVRPAAAPRARPPAQG